jgi:peptidoglycan/LPS O-acetylase OafA/YrhL
MAFSTLLALCLFCAAGALGMFLTDPQWVKEHSWLLPVLWGLAACFLIAAMVSTKWFRRIFVNQEAVSQKAIEQKRTAQIVRSVLLVQ